MNLTSGERKHLVSSWTRGARLPLRVRGLLAIGLVLILAMILGPTVALGQTAPTFLFKFGTGGSGNGQFNFPYDVAVDASGNIYVADSNNHRIQKFDSSGNFLLKWGSFGSSDDQFRDPAGIAVHASGKL